MSDADLGAVREFVHAFNTQDLDRFVSVLDDDVEMHTMKLGLIRGPDAARAWATKRPGGVQQTLELEELQRNGDQVVALMRQVWRWAEEEEGGEPVEISEVAALFTVVDGKITRWEPFTERERALVAAGIV